MQGKDFYFNQPEPECDDPEAELSNIFTIIAKEQWDNGEGLDCVPNPDGLYPLMEELFVKLKNQNAMLAFCSLIAQEKV